MGIGAGPKMERAESLLDNLEVVDLVDAVDGRGISADLPVFEVDGTAVEGRVCLDDRDVSLISKPPLVSLRSPLLWEAETLAPEKSEDIDAGRDGRLSLFITPWRGSIIDNLDRSSFSTSRTRSLCRDASSDCRSCASGSASLGSRILGSSLPATQSKGLSTPS
jgi:hypothetical protein